MHHNTAASNLRARYRMLILDMLLHPRPKFKMDKSTQLSRKSPVSSSTESLSVDPVKGFMDVQQHPKILEKESSILIGSDTTMKRYAAALGQLRTIFQQFILF